MLKRPSIFVIGVVLLLVLLSQVPSKEKTIYFFTNGKNVTLLVEIADTYELRAKGLMFAETLDKNKGMLFVYPDELERTFWMKNTLIPLDMIFAASNGTVVDVIENAMPCEKDPCIIYGSIYPAKYVMETNAGFVKENNISASSVLKLDNLYKTRA